ncbi:hypothetical protein IV203_018905 [Nitzschia inconspicua]|uniref:Uncharacterized protein n=1 Tax=Nitzschia inconspicua TaxID=303405 RepID=A0A9K3Q618_9STRA|nr:hypothetical protein IV203_018905 [Nitzschia inconspicua]
MHPSKIRPIMRVLLVTTVSSIVGYSYQCQPCLKNSATIEQQEGCQELFDASILLDAGTTDCLNAQLRNYQHGCCEEPPRSCTICPNGSPYNPNAIIPSFDPHSGAITCADMNVDSTYLDYIFRQGDCSDTLLQRSASWCGCRQTERSCYLCPDGSRPPNPNLVDPVYYGWTCAAFDLVSSYFSQEECQGLVPDILEFDAPSWCGCPNSPIPQICRLCPEGHQVVRPHDLLGEGDYTCQQLALSTRYIPTQDPCDRVLRNYQEKGYVDYCCAPVGSSAYQTVTTSSWILIMNLVLLLGSGWIVPN